MKLKYALSAIIFCLSGALSSIALQDVGLSLMLGVVFSFYIMGLGCAIVGVREEENRTKKVAN